jgi:hypothetical protein
LQPAWLICISGGGGCSESPAAFQTMQEKPSRAFELRGENRVTNRLSRSTAIAVTSLLFLAVPPGRTCEFSTDYFYQITALKGRVVGLNSRFYAPRWSRQAFARRNTKLALYKYSWPPVRNSMPIRTVETDVNGKFDFGPVNAGHYTLIIGDADSFNVEVKDNPKRTATITIDVSPVSPDCTGGHELLVKTE